jgi:hypothetical protein
MRNALTVRNLLSKWAICLAFFGALLSNCGAAVGPPPIILVQPLGISVLKGGDAIIAVVATGFGTSLSYKWKKDGKNVDDGNKSILRIENVKPKDAGKYYVEIKNASGTVISSNATLLVLSEPLETVLNVLPSVMTTNGFQLRLTGPPGSNFVIMASNDMVNWTPISTNAAPDGTVSFTDTNATKRAFGYYRAELRAVPSSND